MAKFKLEDYTMVKERLKWYKEDHPDFRIVTEVVASTVDLSSVIIKATIYKNGEDLKNGEIHATGLAEELRDAGFVNKTSHVENAETSAIGRALANIDYHGSDKRPSREEMEKVQRTEEAKSKPKKEKPKEETSSASDSTNETVDEIEEKINSFTEDEDVIEYFNKSIEALDGKEKDKFRETYGAIATKKIQELNK